MINPQALQTLLQRFQGQSKDGKPMGLLPDWEIERLAREEGMIEPFFPEKIRKVDDHRVLSFGLSSYGYDLQLSPEQFKIFRHVPGTIINPKDFSPENLEDAQLHSCKGYGKHFIVPGNSYSLGFSLPKIRIPGDVMVLFIGKSTYARSGLIANLTPGEPLWKGHLTIELSNASPADCMIFPDEGIVQALFFRGEPCRKSYGDGKYQNQGAQIVMARV